ncbi:MAG TPA: endonuclease/exonuclease/phosphatase family protein [Solirubrobacterales bacterium]|nr:endonuclease/exonuclease/phosphatase family protein [Solirubrobacterales bacterium]
MKIASYNVENMFLRPLALYDPATKAANEPILQAFARLTTLLAKDSYAADKAEILSLLDTLELLPKYDDSKWAELKEIRDWLLTDPKKPPLDVQAKGRQDWVGWVELKKGEINQTATQNTARVMAEVDADVQVVVEVESRSALQRFNEYVLAQVLKEQGHGQPFAHAMLVDGNDPRGIDVGLLTKAGAPIVGMRSHVDDDRLKSEPRPGHAIFSRDCIEFEVAIGSGGPPLLMLVNHLKSKRDGGDEVRKRQAKRVKEIYRDRRDEGWERIVVAGDLNDTPDSAPLHPLIAETDLKDVSDHSGFDSDGVPGTYGSRGEKIDYLLLSPALFASIRGGGVNRKGVWRDPRSEYDWPRLQTLTDPDEAGSDHAAIWVDLDL